MEKRATSLSQGDFGHLPFRLLRTPSICPAFLRAEGFCSRGPSLSLASILRRNRENKLSERNFSTLVTKTADGAKLLIEHSKEEFFPSKRASLAPQLRFPLFEQGCYASLSSSGVVKFPREAGAKLSLWARSEALPFLAAHDPELRSSTSLPEGVASLPKGEQAKKKKTIYQYLLSRLLHSYLFSSQKNLEEREQINKEVTFSFDVAFSVAPQWLWSSLPFKKVELRSEALDLPSVWDKAQQEKEGLRSPDGLIRFVKKSEELEQSSWGAKFLKSFAPQLRTRSNATINEVKKAAPTPQSFLPLLSHGEASTASLPQRSPYFQRLGSRGTFVRQRSLRGKRNEEFNYFFPYRKSFLCYWLLPFVGFVFTINKETNKDFLSISADSSLNSFSILSAPTSSFASKILGGAKQPLQGIEEEVREKEFCFLQENVISYLLPTVKSNINIKNNIQNNIHIQNNLKQYSNFYLQSLENYVEYWTPSVTAPRWLLSSSSLVAPSSLRAGSASLAALCPKPKGASLFLKTSLRAGREQEENPITTLPFGKKRGKTPLPTKNNNVSFSNHIEEFGTKRSNIPRRKKMIKSFWLDLDLVVSSFNGRNSGLRKPTLAGCSASLSPVAKREQGKREGKYLYFARPSSSFVDLKQKKIQCLQALFLEQEVGVFKNPALFLKRESYTQTLLFKTNEELPTSFYKKPFLKNPGLLLSTSSNTKKNITRINPVLSFLKTSFLLDNFTKKELLEVRSEGASLQPEGRDDYAYPALPFREAKQPFGLLSPFGSRSASSKQSASEGRSSKELYNSFIVTLAKNSSLLKEWPRLFTLKTIDSVQSMQNNPFPSPLLLSSWERPKGVFSSMDDKASIEEVSFLPLKQESEVGGFKKSYPPKSFEKNLLESKLSKEQLYKLLLNSFNKSFTSLLNRQEPICNTLVLSLRFGTKRSNPFPEATQGVATHAGNIPLFKAIEGHKSSSSKGKENLISLPKNIKMSYPILITSHLFLKEKLGFLSYGGTRAKLSSEAFDRAQQEREELRSSFLKTSLPSGREAQAGRASLLSRRGLSSVPDPKGEKPQEGKNSSLFNPSSEKYKIKQRKDNNYPFLGILDKYLKINTNGFLSLRVAKHEQQSSFKNPALFKKGPLKRFFKKASFTSQFLPADSEQPFGLLRTKNAYLHYSTFLKTYNNKLKNLFLISQLKNSSLLKTLVGENIQSSFKNPAFFKKRENFEYPPVTREQEGIDKASPSFLRTFKKGVFPSKTEKLLRTYFSIKNKGTCFLKKATPVKSEGGLNAPSFKRKVYFYDKVKQQLSSRSAKQPPRWFSSEKEGGFLKNSTFKKRNPSKRELGKEVELFSSSLLPIRKESLSKERALLQKISIENKQKKYDQYFQFFLKRKVYTPRLLIKNRSFILGFKNPTLFSLLSSRSMRSNPSVFGSLPSGREARENSLLRTSFVFDFSAFSSDDLRVASETSVASKATREGGEKQGTTQEKVERKEASAANSKETNLEKQRKYIQKKRRRKKLKKETRRRKKRKRFYPRPVWLRYRLFLKLLNKRKTVDSSRLSSSNFIRGTAATKKEEISMHTTKKENFTISRPILGDFKRLLWKSYWLRSNLNPYLKRVKTFLAKMKESTQKWEFFNNFKVLLNYMGGFSSFITKQPSLLLKQSPLVAALPASHVFFPSVWDKEKQGVIMKQPGGVFPLSLREEQQPAFIPQELRPSQQPLRSDYYNSNGFNQWENTLYFAEYNRITYHRIQEFISQIRENFATLGFYSSNSHSKKGVFPSLLEERVAPLSQRVASLSQREENQPEGLLHTPGFLKTIEGNAQKEKKEKQNLNSLLENTKKSLKVRSSHISHTKIQENKREEILSKRKTTDFWVKLGKAIMAENQSASPIGQQTYFKINREWWLFPNYLQKGIPSFTKQGAASMGLCLPKDKPTIPQLRILWALSKTTPSLHLESASDGLVNRDPNNKSKANLSSYLYKRKKTWVEAGKFREQTKYNKTKKMYRDLSMKLQTLLNEQYELISQLLVLPSFGVFSPLFEQGRSNPSGREPLEGQLNFTKASFQSREENKLNDNLNNINSNLNQNNQLFYKLFKKIRYKEEKCEFLNKRNNNLSLTPSPSILDSPLFFKNGEVGFLPLVDQRENKKQSSSYSKRGKGSSFKNPALFKKSESFAALPKGASQPEGREAPAEKGEKSAVFFSSLFEQGRKAGSKREIHEYKKFIQVKKKDWSFYREHQQKQNETWLNNLTSKSSYWWTSQETKNIFSFSHQNKKQNKTLFDPLQNKTIEGSVMVESTSKVLAPWGYSSLQELSHRGVASLPKGEQSQPFFLKTAWVCALLFHFCSILSLLSISQIRGLLKFYLLGISKIYKTSLGIFEYSYTSLSRFKLGTMLSPFPSRREGITATTLGTKGISLKARKRRGPGLLLPSGEGREKRPGSFLKVNEAFRSKEGNTNAEVAHNKDVKQTTQKERAKEQNFKEENAYLILDKVIGNSLNKSISIDLIKYYLNKDKSFSKLFISFPADGFGAKLSLFLKRAKSEAPLFKKPLPEEGKQEGSIQSFLKNHEKKNQSFLALKLIGGFPKLLRGISEAPLPEGKELRGEALHSSTVQKKEIEFLFTIISLFLCSLKKARPFGFLKKWSTKKKSSSSTSTQRVARAGKKIGKEIKLHNKQKHYTTLYSLFLLNFLINNFHNFGSGAKSLLKQTLDVIGRFGPKSIFNFLEKPGELIIDWIAYLFLVEWSSDMTNTIPENVDIYLGTSYYKLTRTLHSLNFLTLLPKNSMQILGIENWNVGSQTLWSLTPNYILPEGNLLSSPERQRGAAKVEGEITILNLGSTFIKNRIYHLYEILLFQFYQPDTDLMVRQKKGIIFWDVWGDFLMQVAEDSNINISELTSLKEEQIKLLEKSSEFVSLQSNKTNNKEQSDIILPFEQKKSGEKLSLRARNEAFLFKKSKGELRSSNKERNSRILSRLVATLLPKPHKKNIACSPEGSLRFAKGFYNPYSKRGGQSNKKGSEESRRNDKFFLSGFLSEQETQKQRATSVGFPTATAVDKVPKDNSIKDNNNFAAQQFLSYQGKDTELFIDLHPPKSFSMISLLKKNESVQTSIGSLVCQIFSGIMSKQISKNILIVGGLSNTKESSHNLNLGSKLSLFKNPVLSAGTESSNKNSTAFIDSQEGAASTFSLINILPETGIINNTQINTEPQNNNQHEKTLLIQAIAGETELKIITDNAYRYAMVYRGVAVGIKLLRDVFDSLSLHTPCLFLIEDIHAIGERRPLLISDDEKGASPNGKPIFGSQREEIHEKNQVLYQLSKHVISHYRKPYKGDFSLLIPTNHFCFDLFAPLNNAGNSSFASSLSFNAGETAPKIFVQSKSVSGLNSQGAGKETNDSSIENESSSSSAIYSGKENFTGLLNRRDEKSRLLIKSSKLFAPPATSPFSVLNLKEEKKFKPYKIVSEMPWGGLPGEQLAQISKASYSIRVKVAVLADMAISTLSVKLDMITDLLVIIDSVKGNRGFVVFATTHVPSILDPALRRPGRLDETITLGLFPNLLSRWHILKSSFGLFITGKEQTGFKKGISLDLTYSIRSSVVPHFVTPPIFPLVSTLPRQGAKLNLKKVELSFSDTKGETSILKEMGISKVASDEIGVLSAGTESSKHTHFDISPKLLLENNQKLKFFARCFSNPLVEFTKRGLFSFFSLPTQPTLFERSFTARNLKISSEEFFSFSYNIKGCFALSQTEEITKNTYRNNKKRIKILSQTYFIASNMIYEANVNGDLALAISNRITSYQNPNEKNAVPVKSERFTLSTSRSSDFLKPSPLKEKNFVSYKKDVKRVSKHLEKKSNFLDFLQPLNMETSSLYISLYASPQQFKNHIIKLMSGKLGEMFFLSQPLIKERGDSFSMGRWSGSATKGSISEESPSSYVNLPRGQSNVFSFTNNYIYNNQYNAFASDQQTEGVATRREGKPLLSGREAFTSFGLSNTWKLLSSLILSFVQKRYLYNNNLIVPKFLYFNNKNSLYEPPSPPSSNILLPARRYENYRRSFSFFSGRQISLGIMEKIQAHQQQRLVKRLYGFPVKESFKSEIRTYSSMTKPSSMGLGQSKQENSFTNFTNATLMIGSLSSVLQKPSNSNWFIKNRILMRHKNYLTNQWWNGQLPEHNAETTFLSDIDWRYSFVESIGDLLLDFPDADQHYNPRNRRWLLTKGDYHNWFNFEKNFYNEIYTHFIFDSFIKAYHLYEENREALDFYAFYILKKGLYNISTPSEIETITLYKRFFMTK
uniref:cell division protein n=1 Tax=Chlorococcum tatrense TaxID=915274 RepID=UPI0010C25B04|nr:cell division protein [Chlorococcum tatrense]AYQ94355.1 cell division protein [Chlorococcum tatrense]